MLWFGLPILWCAVSVAGGQIWAEYAQSLPVPGIAAADAYTLSLFGVGLHCGTHSFLALPVLQAACQNIMPSAGLGTAGIFDYLHLTAAQVGYPSVCTTSLSVHCDLVWSCNSKTQDANAAAAGGDCAQPDVRLHD